MKLYDTGVYLQNGQEIIPENQADLPVAKEEAARNTIAYSILKAHNKSDNMEKLQIKFDKLTSHDITFVGIIQTARASGLEKKGPAIAGYIGAILYEILLWATVPEGELMAVAVGTLLIMAVYVFGFPKYKVNEIFCAVAGLAYVVVLMSFIYKVRMLNDGLYIIPLIFICAWGNDTCAYCVGMLIGKHKMFPRLSPKKSVEGFVGGIAGAVILGLIYGRIFGAHLISLSVPMRDCAIIAGVGALIAVVGDLAASAIKRDTGIKDYGRLIPGHGGILDRFDSILFTAPVVYILAVCLGA